MSSTLTAGRISGNGSGHVGIEPAKRRQRSLPLAGVAAICMLATIVAFVGLQLAASDRQPVLALARPVAAGSTLSAEDLAIAHVADDPALRPVPLSAKQTVIGQVAASDLAAGTLLTERALGASTVVGDGEALVGVEVLPAAAPVDALHAGDRVRVIGIDKGTDGRSDQLGAVLAEGRVVRVATNPGRGTSATSVSLVVPADDAPAVAGASVAQRVALVVIR